MTATIKHLWQVEHDYYCSENNYFNGDQHRRWKSWAEFTDEFGNSDIDQNLVFRFDWKEGKANGLPEHNGDDYYRNGELQVCFIGQRRGLFFCSTVEVCRADEPSVIAWLKPRHEHLFKLWEPLA
ncbi:hypothetical protein ACCS79_03440 [Rhizobium johnstonii]|uniref:hypothetical protein n=1 Tax=Rhizobium johnstonii TaxID=3019933 RepID=UPI003F9C4572